MLTKHQVSKLKKFSETTNNSEASLLIQESTDILKNMFTHVNNFDPEAYFENISRSIINTVMDSRLQIAIFSLMTVKINLKKNYLETNFN